jgi:micrococcal nuclease
VNKRLLATHLLIFFLGLVIGSFITQAKPQPLSPVSSPALSTLSATESGVLAESSFEKALVKRVIDGDTIELADGRKLRYIGIDTPETVNPNRPTGCFGKEASLKNRELVSGKEVELEKDVSETDRYGRLLRYVYLVIGGERTMVNELLVKEGYANASSYPPDIKYQEKLKNAERLARETKVGLWGLCTLLSSVSPVSSTQTQTEINDSVKTPVASQATTSQVQGNTTEGCSIKGNISSSGDKIYHLVGCGSYEKTVIDETAGERYFCSESEAEAFGWRKAKNC